MFKIFFLDFAYVNFLIKPSSKMFIVKSNSIKSNDRNASSSIKQQYSFIIIDSAEKDVSHFTLTIGNWYT